MIAQSNATETIREVLAEAHAGRLIFPQVVQRMLAANVESYFVDLRSAQDTVYLNDDTMLTEPLHLDYGSIAQEFSKPGIVAAIRAAQRDEIRYPEFMRRAAAAGVVAYWALLTGKRVIYFGRLGDIHVEWFPGARPAAVSTTLSVEIRKPAQVAYDFLADPSTMPRWAIHNVRSIAPIDAATWKIETPRGSGRLIPHYAANGVLDHEFVDPQEGRWPVTARVVPLGAAASLYQITLVKPEGMPDELFWQGIPLVDEELQALKSCVEAL
ncbi:MAG TPA: DUF1398 family protein [Terracidiphilus sp.]|nr:DUF1398 family protein [Terracidiphilus sp.]